MREESDLVREEKSEKAEEELEERDGGKTPSVDETPFQEI
jgi:hypothetical protein